MDWETVGDTVGYSSLSSFPGKTYIFIGNLLGRRIKVETRGLQTRSLSAQPYGQENRRCALRSAESRIILLAVPSCSPRLVLSVQITRRDESATASEDVPD